MSKIKVLIVDDSALIRAALTKILSSDTDIEIVGTAPDAYIAVEKIKKLNPDVITLDIEMPGMDGLTFLDKIMKSNPIPVVMISTWTKTNSDKAIKSLSLGAVDFVEKPTSSEQVLELGDEIISKVKNAAHCSVKKLKKNVLLVDTIKPNNMNKIDDKKDVKANTTYSRNQKSNNIILIGASTGGTTAIETIVKKLPEHMPAIIIVQHMPENFTKAFADRLNSLYKLEIKEAEHDDIVYDNTIYIAPGGKQCYVKRIMGHYIIQIADDPPVNKCKPSVDSLFLSAAQNPCNNIIGVILTGMGKDGAQGMLAMKRAGSYNISQDEASCVIFGMPKEAIALGGVDEIISLDDIPSRLVSLSSK